MSGNATLEQPSLDTRKSAVSIYALGSNGSGQLGIGHTEDVSTPSLIDVDLAGVSVKRIVAGGNHTLLLLENGTVYSTGNDEDGRCGHGGVGDIDKMRRVALPQLTESSDVVEIAASWSASYFVLQDSVLVCGTGEHGELGLGQNITTTKTLQKITFPDLEDSIVQISACLSHAAALTSDGQIFGWGNGRKGQLGEPSEEVWIPRKILDLRFHVQSTACGVDFTCGLGSFEQGQIEVLGCGSRDRFKIKSAAPSAIPAWKALAASWGSLYVLLKDGTIKSWGRNDRGQLPIDEIPWLCSFAAGSEHWLAISLSSKILTAGWSEHGNCGSPSDEFGVVKDRWNELEVPGKAIKVFAGCATSFIVVEMS